MFDKKRKIIYLIIFIIFLGILFSFIKFKNTKYDKTIGSKENTAIALSGVSGNNTNTLRSYFLKDKKYINEKPKVEASAYLVGDIDTGEVIISKNQNEQFPLASVSKLMTALVAKQSLKENAVAKVSKTALSTYGKNGNLKLGEKIKITDLIYPLLLESSNDAAEVIAEYFNRNIFLKKMNQEALKLDLSKTIFDDPSGLSSKNESSVFDMFKLAGYINQKEPNLFQITTQKSYSNKIHSWSSNNQFLNEDGYQGGKSGFTDPALETVVSIFSVPLSETGTRNIAITLLQSKDRFKDVNNILQYLNKYIYYGGQADANTAWVKEKENLPLIYDQDYVTLAFGGDIMLDRGVKSSVNKNFNGDYATFLEKLNIFKKYDIAFANLEGPVSDIGKDMHNLYSFRMSPSVAPALKGIGLSIVSVANNHVGDWGRDAYADTLTNLEENEILYTGGGKNVTEATKPTIVEKYGMKIGFLGFSDVGPNWMSATEDKAGLLLANDPRFDEIIQNASKEVDYLIVSFHFGTEYKTKHNERQEYLAHKAIDNGAKIVVGSHPHVAEDIEVYSPKDCTQSSCMGFIAYSLGNLVFDQGFSAKTMQGMILEVKLNRDGSMSVKKDTVMLNKSFQPEKIIYGKEETVKFQEIKTQ